MKGQSLLVSRIGCLFFVFAHSPAIAQSVLTWQSLQASVQQETTSSLKSLFPSQLPPEFADGQFAITSLHTGKTTYVVTKVGRKLSNVSTVVKQSGRNINFNAANGYPDLANIPALASFPTQLYSVGELVEVSRYAARYDGEDTRSRARQSQKRTLRDGRNAYYLRQDSGRQGWCAFESESAKFSRFICVNIIGSSNSALTLLESIFVKTSSPQVVVNRSPSTPQAYKERGDTRSSNGDKQGAIADYTEAIRLNSSFASAYYNRAIDRVAIGDKQGAIADFKKAAELFGNQGRGSDRQDALSEIAKLGGERSPQGKPVLQTFKDAKALRMAQILQGNQRLVTSHGGLKRVVEGNYQIPEIPKSGFLDDRFTDVAETPGQLFGKRKDVSYADYLRLKFKVAAQQNALNQGANVVSTGVQEYLDLLAKDSRSGGKQTSDSVLTKFKDYYNQIQPRNKKITLGNLNYALEETRVSTGELIQGTIKTGGKLAAAFTQLGKLAKTFDRPEIKNVSAYTKVGRSLEWTISMKQKLEELQRAANQGDNDKIRDLALNVASETLQLIDSQDTRLSRSRDAIKIRSIVMALKERDKFIRESKATSVLDGLDKIYLVTAQASSAVEIIAATTTFIAPQNQAAVKLSEKLDALRALFFDALEFTYKEDVRKQHERLSVVSKRYEDILPGLFSTIDSSAEEIGQYLLKSRTDVVTRRSDGTIAVSINGVVNPPKP